MSDWLRWPQLAALITIVATADDSVDASLPGIQPHSKKIEQDFDRVSPESSLIYGRQCKKDIDSSNSDTGG